MSTGSRLPRTGAMVFPTRVADVNRGVRHQLLQVIGTDLERAGPAQRLRRDDATFGQQLRIGAEDQFLYDWL